VSRGLGDVYKRQPQQQALPPKLVAPSGLVTTAT
jgi:hypothetical protein